MSSGKKIYVWFKCSEENEMQLRNVMMGKNYAIDKVVEDPRRVRVCGVVNDDKDCDRVREDILATLHLVIKDIFVQFALDDDHIPPCA